VNDVAQIALPLPFNRMAAVNTWLLRGDPLTLVDAGLRDDAARSALEQGLRKHGVRVEDLELVLLTHAHVEHVGLAPEIRERSGARVAALHPVADRCATHRARIVSDRQYTDDLMRAHGVPAEVVAGTDGFWAFERNGARSFDVDLRLEDGAHIRAGGRDLRAVLRPGHSLADTVFVDDRDGIAFSGDHLLATISSNTEIVPDGDDQRPRARVSYLDGLRRTATMALHRLFTGHGDVICDHPSLIRTRLAEHDRRGARITAMLRTGPASAWQLARGLWPDATVHRQPLLVTWEVLGHLDVLAAAGVVREHIDPDGHATFDLTEARAA
jgi:glyoxylase-like metal-dependent hydrolase (beta-lactamase superfamily II)